MTDTAERVAAARAARRRLAGLPLRARAEALAAAALRWRRDRALAAALPAACGLSAPMVEAVLPIAADALTAAAMIDLVERELGPGAADRPPPAGPELVLQVLASNVPALALPAIVHGALVGAAVVVKSGRHDPHSAPAFQRALAAEHAELAETIVPVYWGHGDDAPELAAADVVVLTGGDDAIAALAPRVRGRLLTHGPRTSVALVARAALADPARVAEAVALDVALHDQRGCLSPETVLVETGGAVTPLAFATALAGALDGVAARLPPGRAPLEERAAGRVTRAAAEWEPGARVLGGPGGTVIVDARAGLRAGPGGRTVRVQPLARAADLADLLPAGAVECVGLAGADAGALGAALRARGVARLCPAGRMQRPALSWPRGQHAPLGALLGHAAAPRLEVEA